MKPRKYVCTRKMQIVYFLNMLLLTAASCEDVALRDVVPRREYFYIGGRYINITVDKSL